MKKLVSMLLCLAMLSATACSSGGGSSGISGNSSAATAADKPFDGTTIRFIAVNHVWTDSVRERIPEFTEKTGININIEGLVEDQLSQKLSVEAAAKSKTLDLMTFRPLQDAKRFINNGWLTELSGYFDENFDVEDLVPSALAAFQNTDGTQTYGVPLITEREILYYRKDLLAEKGIEVPTNFDELKAAAEKLTDKNNEMYGFASRGQRNPAVTQFSSFLFSNGGDFVSPDAKTATMDTPEAIEALQFYGDMLYNYGPPGALNMSWSQVLELFAQGKVAMATDCDAVFSTVTDPEKSKVADKVGFAMFPGGFNGKPAKPYNVCSWGLAIGANSEKKDAAWEFIKWAASKDGMTEAQKIGCTMARISVWADPEANDSPNLPKELVEVANASAKIGYKYDRPPIIAVAESRDIIGAVMTAAIEGQDITQMAKDANKEFQALIDKEQ